MATSNAAKMIGMENEIGALKVGGVADISVLEDRRGRWVLEDNEGTQVGHGPHARPALLLARRRAS